MSFLYRKSEIGNSLGVRISEIVRSNTAKGVSTSVAVSGSSQPILLAPAFGSISVDWNFVHFYFSDERCVSFEDRDSNYAAWNTLFFEKYSIPAENIHCIAKEYNNAEEAAYEKDLKSLPQSNGFPVFDIIVLGMGPDGHTCSLFPNHPEINDTTHFVTFINNSPKLPASRITLTLPVLNNAKHVFFLVTGKDKANMIHAIAEKRTDVPSSRVKPTYGEIVWFLDEEASNSCVY